nr:putative ribonuclease H-like domain-containing protein [Tanacetum cinerariifolium]
MEILLESTSNKLTVGFEDPDYLDKVYKVVKALYGLHQAPRAWYETLAIYLLENAFQRGKIDQTLFIKKQKDDILLKQDRIFISQDKYVAKILRKFGLTDGKSASTPIDTEKPLLKDPDREDVDVRTYRSMTGSLMYLTSSRPGIIFAVYARAHFQVTPKALHLHAVKRIFRYLKGKPHLGLLYPKDSPFNLVAYSDSDYAGASLDRKSTTGGCQFLGCRLIYWQCKKQTVFATSSTEAEKKVIITEATVQEALQLNDADSIGCLPNKEIFTELVRMGLVKNVDSSSKFYMYIRFLQLMILAQVGDISYHTTKYSSPALTQKVFANISRVGKGFSRVETPLFKGMLVPQQAADDIANVAVDDVNDVITKDATEPTLPSPTPQPPQELPSTSQILLWMIRRIHPNRGIIADLDADKDVTLEEVDTAKDVAVEKNIDVQGRPEESQAQVYHIDLEHADKVLKVVTDATTTITAAPSAAKRRKGVKRKEKEDNVVLRYQTLKRKPQTEAQARKNMIVYMKNMAGFKMDYFKAKKQKLEKEVEDLKKHLQIMPNDDDDVYIEATPLAIKMMNNVRLEVKEESKVSLELLSFGVDAAEDFKEYTLRDYNCWLKTYNCACIYGAFMSVDTIDILTNDKFPILDVWRKIISKDNDGEVGNKGFPHLISHLKRLHLSSDEHKCVFHEAISTYHGLYMAVKETLKVFNQWLCGKSMDLHAVSCAFHHPDGLVRFSKGSDDMSGYIVGISNPSNKECIPHGCRLTFSQALKTVLCKVVTQLDFVDAWVRLLLFPRCTLQVYRPKNRQERRSRNRKSLQQSSIVKSLAMWRKDDGITMLVKSILYGFALGSFGQGGGDFLEEGATGNTDIKQCLCKVVDGHSLAAVKVLSSSGVAPYCDDTINALEAKNLNKPPHPCLALHFLSLSLAWHILDALCGDGSATDIDLLKVITLVVNLWLAGRCPPILAEFVAMKGMGKEMSKYLSDFNLGSESGGGEAILHIVNRLLSEYRNDGSLAMLTMDFSNAFNLVDGSTLLYEVRVKCPFISLWVDFLYEQASRLNIGDTHICSATEVQQAWYLDNGTAIRDSEEVSKVLDIIKESGLAVSLIRTSSPLKPNKHCDWGDGGGEVNGGDKGGVMRDGGNGDVVGDEGRRQVAGIRLERRQKSKRWEVCVVEARAINEKP